MRDHLKEDLRGAIGQSSDVATKLPAAIISALADQVVNVVVTPQGLSQLVTEFGTRRPAADTKGGVVTASEVDVRYPRPVPSGFELRVAPTLNMTMEFFPSHAPDFHGA